MTNRDGRVPLDIALLKRLRRAKGLSQEKLAELCFERGLVVSISSIKRAESGANVLHRTAANLAKLFEVQVEQLLASPSHKIDLVQPSAISDKTLALIVDIKPPLTATHIERKLRDEGLEITTQGQRCVIRWPMHECDEFIFVHITQLARQLQRQFNNAIRIILTSDNDPYFHWLKTKPFDFSQANGFFNHLAWGEAAACSCFVSSNCLSPKQRLHVNGQTGHWYLVSLSQTNNGHFIGRQKELKALSAGIEYWLKHQTGQAFCLTGMAGIGKTRLLNQTIQTFEAQCDSITQIQNLNHGRAEPQSPTNVLVRSICGFLRTDSDEHIRRHIIESRIPSSCHLCLYWLMGVSLNETEKRLLDLMEFHSLQETIEQSAPFWLLHSRSLRPQLIVIEDVHWADSIMFTILANILPHITNSNVFIILTFRKQQQLSLPQPWFKYVNLIELNQLSEEEAYQLASSVVPEQHELIENCLKLAKGHPLFLRQTLLCAKLSTGVPESLEHIVSTQLAQLPFDDHLALQTASVLGQYFQLDQLREIANLPNYVPDTLLEMGLVKLQGLQYIFHHDLICSAICNQIEPSEKEKIHLRCAKWYQDKDLYLYAIHTQYSDTDNAFEVLDQTAHHYLNNFQFEKALSLIDRATKIAPPHKFAYALNMKGNCLYSMGKVPESIEVLELAVENATNDLDKTQFHLDLIKPYRLTDRFEQAMNILDLAQQYSEQQGRYKQLCEIHSMRGNMLFPTGQLNACEHEHVIALNYSQQANCVQARAKSLGGLGDCAYAQGKMVKSYDYLTQCLELCEQHHLLSTETTNRYMLATVMIYQLQSSEALKHAQHASNLAYLTANRRAEIVARLTASWIFLERNDLAQAEHEIETALQLSKQLEAHRFVAFLLESRARLNWYRGQKENANKDIETGLKLVERYKLHNFIGPWLASTQALVCEEHNSAFAYLELGESWLESTCVGHNYLRFYQQAIQVAWEYKAPSLLKRYRDKLATFSTDDCNPWSEFYIKQADVMLALLNQSSSVSDLLHFNQAAQLHHLEQAKISVDEFNQWLYAPET